MSYPKIGITTAYSDGVQRVSHHYIRAIEAAGGLPLLVPMLSDPAYAKEFTAMLDGLVITGGPAIEKGMLGERPADLDPTDPIRIHADELVYGNLQAQPVLGICYGMQFINAQAGGTIYGDLMAHQPDALTHSASRGGQPHLIYFEPNTHLQAIFNQQSLTVNTYHLQSVAQVGHGLRIAAVSPDGIIEAIESTDGRRIGVQFHPELMLEQTLPLFKAFVDQCRKG